jgi:hypothetical protein
MTRTPPPSLAPWLLAAWTLAAPAHAFVLCARGDAGPNEGASVKVRSACKDNETTIDPGALGLSATVSTVVRTGNPLSTNGTLSNPASCLPGEVATGGGALTSSADGGLAVVKSSRPQPDTAGATPTSWRVTVANVSDTGTISSTTYVVCMPRRRGRRDRVPRAHVSWSVTSVVGCESVYFSVTRLSASRRFVASS